MSGAKKAPNAAVPCTNTNGVFPSVVSVSRTWIRTRGSSISMNRDRGSSPYASNKRPVSSRNRRFHSHRVACRYRRSLMVSYAVSVACVPKGACPLSIDACAHLSLGNEGR